MPSARLEEVKSSAYPSLERKKGKGNSNWVEAAGGLPSYIERIAKHLHYEKGHSISSAIAMAVNTVKRWAKGTNHNGGKLKPGTVAKAAKAVAEWTKKKASRKGQKLNEEIFMSPDEQAELGRILEGRLTLCEGMIPSLEGGREAAVRTTLALLEADAGGKVELAIGGGQADPVEVAEARAKLEEEIEVLEALVDGLLAEGTAAQGSSGKCAKCGKKMPKRVKAGRERCPNCGKTVKAKDIAEGTVDEAAVYGTAFTADEVREHYLEEAPRGGSGGRGKQPAPKGNEEKAQNGGPPPAEGNDGERVSALQRRLASLGHDLKDDGKFGPKTDEAVKEFQRNSLIKEDGVVGGITTSYLKMAPPPEVLAQAEEEDENPTEVGSAPVSAGSTPGAAATASAPEPGAAAPGAEQAPQGEVTLPSVLYKGMGVGGAPDPAVKEVQSQLKATGQNVEEDGVFGPETEKRTKSFQKKWGLKADGMVGKKTQNTLAVAGKKVKALTEATAARQRAADENDVAGFVRARARETVLRRRLEEGNAGLIALVAKLMASGSFQSEEQAKAVAAKLISSGKVKMPTAKRGAAPRTNLQLKRMPDGEFAPKGVGQVLKAGDAVDVPHKSGKGHVLGVVGKKGEVELLDGPDAGWKGKVGKSDSGLDAQHAKSKAELGKAEAAGDAKGAGYYKSKVADIESAKKKATEQGKKAKASTPKNKLADAAAKKGAPASMPKGGLVAGEKVGPGKTWADVEVGDTFTTPPTEGAEPGEPGYQQSGSLTVVKVRKNDVVLRDEAGKESPIKKLHDLNSNATYEGKEETPKPKSPGIEVDWEGMGEAPAGYAGGFSNDADTGQPPQGTARVDTLESGSKVRDTDGKVYTVIGPGSVQGSHVLQTGKTQFQVDAGALFKPVKPKPAARKGEMPKPPQSPGTGPKAGTPYTLQPNAENLSLKDMPFGTVVALNDGSTYRLHKDTGNKAPNSDLNWIIWKPVDENGVVNGKAKVIHPMLAPPQHSELEEPGVAQVTPEEPEVAPEGGELFDKLSDSVAAAKKGKEADAPEHPNAKVEAMKGFHAAAAAGENPLGAATPPKASLHDSPGRGPQGNIRNMKAMGKAKLIPLIQELEAFGEDPEALAAAKAAAAAKGFQVEGADAPSKPAAKKAPPKTDGGREPFEGLPFSKGEEIKDKTGMAGKVVDHHPHATDDDKDKFTVEFPDGQKKKVGYTPINDVLSGKKEWGGVGPKPKADTKPKTPKAAKAKKADHSGLGTKIDSLTTDSKPIEVEGFKVAKTNGGIVVLSDSGAELFSTSKEATEHILGPDDTASKNAALDAYKANGGNDPEIIAMLQGKQPSKKAA